MVYGVWVWCMVYGLGMVYGVWVWFKSDVRIFCQNLEEN